LDTRTEIKEFIVDNFMMGMNPENLTNNVSLLELGIIDSTGVLELVQFLEEKYGIQVEDADLTLDNLDSLDNLVGYLNRKKSVS